MNTDFTFAITRSRFDENYNPSENTRITTNFANLARGENRQQNLRNTLIMIDNRFNTLAHWDNPQGDRYAVELDIISVEMKIAGSAFPAIEILQTNIIDKKTNERIAGLAGNNFSSYVRDYDFSVLLLGHNKDREQFSLPAHFGDLHGNIFKHFVQSAEYRAQFKKPPVICLSVSNKNAYQRTGNQHPVLGIEYQQHGTSLTETYFSKMGLQVRYFMPKNSAAPLAFFFTGDLLGDYSDLELIGTIATMETFQKIYRPEIYNANSAAGLHYQPNLSHEDHSLTKIVYDREERSRLAIEQGKFTEEHFIKPYKKILEQWSANYAR
ncbi:MULTISPECIES: DUF1852 domain-containing protein [Enterobacteriaceae]|uniref:DUF1852 domain-containing protein n=1 Tax=Kluyvera genomosp. 2 TaxID=2774054 RepID=A0A2T2Y849_9ENTR|nr:MULTISPECIES: DUF1852 domain-containing protein [Enterobacteriaceae]HAT3916587.1 DUF1852 domain-containing protein [Kluyvera ascorbata]PSR48697.1 DUF1852 domain-containing protein [Kluyvera genomosp. 2]BBQ82984.1 hypothetical protein WP3W18E02_15130 [Klebsiella sp. WP3-W18-ESBL-02]BBR20018.1 hypothetical protein WP3S18E05_14980 [Klebsiella sp. WP3-S18-ESBL-05]BBR59750.1 hypothetical protein WP4W18E05_31180 [Klebsiella sp. WP4-W18-ESBL-05]